MKKALAIISTVLVVLSTFGACKNPDTVQSTKPISTTAKVEKNTKAVTTFSHTVETPIKAESAEKKAYFYKNGATDVFEPNKNYGKIMPYIAEGTFRDDVNSKFGFTTVDGKIITKGIYSYIMPFESDNGTVYYATVEDEGINDVISADGTWIANNVKKCFENYYIGEDNVVYNFKNEKVFDYTETHLPDTIEKINDDFLCYSLYNQDDELYCIYNINNQHIIEYADIDYIKDCGDVIIIKMPSGSNIFFDKNMKQIYSDKYSKLSNYENILYDETHQIFLGYNKTTLEKFDKNGKSLGILFENKNGQSDFMLSVATLFNADKYTIIIYNEAENPTFNVHKILKWIDITNGKDVSEKINERKDWEAFCNSKYLFIENKDIQEVYDVNGNCVHTTDRKINQPVFNAENITVNSNCYVEYASNKITINSLDFKLTDTVTLKNFKDFNIKVFDENAICINSDKDNNYENGSQFVYFNYTGKYYLISNNYTIDYVIRHCKIDGNSYYAFVTDKNSYVVNSKGEEILVLPL